jgi:hypothetical protein
MIGEYERHKLGTVRFGLRIEGDYEEVTSVRLSLTRGGVGVLVEGAAAGGEASFDLSPAGAMLASGDYEARLEVILDGARYYAPVRDTIRIRSAPRVEAVPAPPARPEPAPARVAAAPIAESGEERWAREQESRGRTVVLVAPGRYAAMRGRSKVDEYVSGRPPATAGL